MTLDFVVRTQLKKDQKAKTLVVLAHGYGADCNNLLGLEDHFYDILEDSIFVFVNAPEVFEFGPPGYQWYSLMDRSENVLLDHSRRVAKLYETFIEELLTKYSVDYKDIILMGFSQGAMVSLFSGIRMKECVKAIIGFSGTIIGPSLIAQEALQKPPVCLIHGDKDEVVPIALSKIAHKHFIAAGFNCQFNQIPNLTHTIDFEALSKAQHFLRSLNP